MAGLFGFLDREKRREEHRERKSAVPEEPYFRGWEDKRDDRCGLRGEIMIEREVVDGVPIFSVVYDSWDNRNEETLVWYAVVPVRINEFIGYKIIERKPEDRWKERERAGFIPGKAGAEEIAHAFARQRGEEIFDRKNCTVLSDECNYESRSVSPSELLKFWRA